MSKTVDVLKRFEEVALLGADAVEAALTYQGENPIYMRKGVLGAQVQANYTRLHGSMTARDALGFQRQRYQRELPDAGQ